MYLEVPVWRPSMEEFADFSTFIRSVWEKSVGCGMMKVIPPPEWKSLCEPGKSYEKAISVLIPAPVKQVSPSLSPRFSHSQGPAGRERALPTSNRGARRHDCVGV
jgi:hypothetical protein